MNGEQGGVPVTNVESVTAAYEAFARSDTASVVALFGSTIEWRLAEHHPYNPTNEAWTTAGEIVRGLFERVAQDWERFRCTPTRFYETHEHVLVEGRYVARYRPTQRDEDAQFCHIWKLRDGRIIGFQQYVDTAQIRDVMGVTQPVFDGRRVFAEPTDVDATWIHRDARQGFESASLRNHGDGHRLIGQTSANEDGVGWSVGYRIDVDSRWRTVRAHVTEVVAARERHCVIESDRAGRWIVDGVDAPHLDGCIDIDLESSALTNTVFLHRVQPTSGELYDAPAAFVRCAPLRLERLEQTYRRAIGPAHADEVSFEYKSPAYGTDIVLRFDQFGLVNDYPGLATRYS
jgi:hypothetical protein